MSIPIMYIYHECTFGVDVHLYYVGPYHYVLLNLSKLETRLGNIVITYYSYYILIQNSIFLYMNAERIQLYVYRYVYRIKFVQVYLVFLHENLEND